MNEEFYISIVGEIFDGYTEFEFNNRSLYLKHLTVKDQRYLHLYYEKYKKRATDKGVETEAEILEKVKLDDLWSDDEDVAIESLRNEIENLQKTKKSFFLNSQKESVQKTINEKQNEYITLLSKRKEIVGKTAEDYATNMAAVEMIRYFVFDSKELNNQAFDEDQFDDMDDDDLLKLKIIQSSVNEKLNELDIQKCVLRPFFSMYLSYCESPSDFFGKPIINLSVFQMRLVLFGKVFHSIFQYTENIPDGIREDPEKLLAFSEAKNSKDSGRKQFINDDAAGSAVFGGTEEDIKDLAESGGTSVRLSDEIKKAGGKLTMEQMMKLAGQ